VIDSGPVTCPTDPCPGTSTCCADLTTDQPACASTCTANDSIGCTGPANCTGSDAGAQCCATAVLENNPDGAAFPHCVITALTSYCGTCTTNVAFSCAATDNL